MEKNIKGYLPLYLGCECIADQTKFKLHGVELTDTGTLAYDGTMIDGIHQCWWVENCDFKILLRPFSDITKEEETELEKTRVFVRATPVHIVGNMQWTAETYRWALSKHFDLFNLIESGLAIDKTKLSITT